MERLRARDLQGHDGNWRTHPQFQQDALAGVLREIGIAGALLVYKSPARDGAYTLIDGHLRKALDPEQTWPCLVLDVDDDEAQYILATHDPLTALAEADTDALRRVLAEVQSGEAAVQALLSRLAEDTGVLGVLEGAGVPPDGVTPGAGTMQARFLVPPFSVLDARQGYWQDRKRSWLALGIQSELGRGEGMTWGDSPEVTSPGGQPSPGHEDG
jgi:hypothetical protein